MNRNPRTETIHVAFYTNTPTGKRTRSWIIVPRELTRNRTRMIQMADIVIETDRRLSTGKCIKNRYDPINPTGVSNELMMVVRSELVRCVTGYCWNTVYREMGLLHTPVNLRQEAMESADTARFMADQIRNEFDRDIVEQINDLVKDTTVSVKLSKLK